MYVYIVQCILNIYVTDKKTRHWTPLPRVGHILPNAYTCMGSRYVNNNIYAEFEYIIIIQIN